MSDPISREELYSIIDRQSAHLEQIIDRGFDNVNRRLDVANGRTTKLEDRHGLVERDVAVLLDRAIQAETNAEKARSVAGNSKWWGTAAAGAIVTLFEAIKTVLTN